MQVEFGDLFVWQILFHFLNFIYLYLFSSRLL